MPPGIAPQHFQKGAGKWEKGGGKAGKGGGKRKGGKSDGRWICENCGFRNVLTNQVCGGGGTAGCKAAAPPGVAEAAAVEEAGRTPEQLALADRVKQLQKSKPGFRDDWAYILQEWGRADVGRDPTRHRVDILQAAVDSVRAEATDSWQPADGALTVAQSDGPYNAGTCIFVGQLARDVRTDDGSWEKGTTDEDLLGYFSRYGEVTSANVQRAPQDQASRGYGFVEFADAGAAQAACAAGREQVIGGVTVCVKPSRKDGAGAKGRYQPYPTPSAASVCPAAAAAAAADPMQPALAERVKQLQRAMPDFKAIWTSIISDWQMNSVGRDPARHGSDILRAAIAAAGVAETGPLPFDGADDRWKCTGCGFRNVPSNAVCGGGGPAGCGAPAPPGTAWLAPRGAELAQAQARGEELVHGGAYAWPAGPTIPPSTLPPAAVAGKGAPPRAICVLPQFPQVPPPPVPAGADPGAGSERLVDLVAFICDQLGIEPAETVADTVAAACAQLRVPPPDVSAGRSIVAAARDAASQLR